MTIQSGWSGKTGVVTWISLRHFSVMWLPGMYTVRYFLSEGIQVLALGSLTILWRQYG